MSKGATCWLAAPVLAAAAFAQTSDTVAREGDYWVRTVSGSLDAARARALSAVAWGDLSVLGVDSDTVSYTLTHRVKTPSEAAAKRLLSQLRIRPRRSGDVVYLEALSRLGLAGTVALQVQAPRRLTKFELVTHGGRIEAHALDGDLALKSGGGRIVAQDIGGGITAETGGGEIHLGNVGGAIRCLSGGGNIRVERAGAESWFETAGGEIYVGEAAGPVHASTGGGNIHVQRAKAGVSARTAGGLIEVVEAGGEVVAETASGAIRVGAASGVRCESARGAIRLRDVSGSLRAMTAAGNIFAELPFGAQLRDSFLDTSFGDVTVFIPSNVAVTVKAHNIPVGRGGRIISEFPEIKVRGGSQPAFEPVFAEGAVNGGGPLLRISAAGGTVYLRRR